MQCLVKRAFKRNGNVIAVGEIVELPESEARMLEAANKVDIVIATGVIGAIGDESAVDLVNESAKSLRPTKRKGKTA